MNNCFSGLMCGVLFILTTSYPHAGELNWGFVRGGNRADMKAWDDSTNKFMPGRFLVDVELNDKHIGKRILNILPEDKSDLCLSEQWLRDAGININTDFYAKNINKERQCYVIANDINTTVNMDFSTQNINFKIPQKGLDKKQKAVLEWDYGIPALRMNYSASTNVNKVGTSSYGSLGLLANAGKWVGDSFISISESDVNISTGSARRALYDWKSDLTIGRTFTSNSLIGGASLMGVGLVSNSNMRANEIGYSPVFSGIAKSNAKVVLSQSGSTIYIESVPAGPFEIRDVRLLSSGDVTMTITEEDGSVLTQVYPLTVIPNMLSSGDYEYSVYSGLRQSGTNDLNGLFWAGNVGYGFENFTLKTSVLLHAKYVAFGAGLVRGLGHWGTLGAQSAYSHAIYDDNSSATGGRVSMTYGKKLDKSTSLQVTSAQYLSQGYTEFSNFAPDAEGARYGSSLKSQYNLGLSHRITTNLSVGFRGWKRSYWEDVADNSGINARASLQFRNFNVSLVTSYSQSGNGSELSGSLSLSVPFSIGGSNYSTYSTVTTNDNGSSNYSTGVSSSIGEKANYSANINWSGDSDSKTYSVSTGYQAERASLRGRLSQSNGQTTGSASASGSVILLPTERDMIFTGTRADTLIVANVADTEGVKFSSSPYRSTSKGNAVVPASAYRENRIRLSGDTLPTDIELLETEKRVVPTGGAVVFLPFESVKVLRYLFQIKNKQGAFVQSGTWAESKDGTPLGFVTQNGILSVNSIDELKSFRVGDCEIPTSSIKQTTQLQEVMCEN
ncbi:fimbria/pilus outer membrane usher protein [Vibrio mediterranei]|uniref:PapC N-terminal domain-containing protein n=2 Tax=Vibrio TaxID=662 RepID=A0ABX5DEQ6_9VIBR|nr:fimbria/pilus outer membrane usher protein [Vibrio mediterranei]PCD88742.1 hypothetical protein COR52_10040 [Vibrio mediterranei]PRQ68032.1 hypothetical protein COR51_10350 [Vibrio mediterranei]